MINDPLIDHRLLYTNTRSIIHIGHYREDLNYHLESLVTQASAVSFSPCSFISPR